MITDPKAHGLLAEAIALLAKAGSFKDPATRLQMLRVAKAMEAVRHALETRAHAVALARLRALGVTAARLAKIFDRLEGGPLLGLIADGDRAAANWSAGMLGHGWHGLSPTSRIACGVGVHHASFSEASDDPTLHWIASGEVPLYLQRSWQVLGGVIDTALLRSLSDLARSMHEYPDARSPVFAGGYRDTLHQLECMASALLSLDLRLQECAWMLTRLSDRLDPLAQRVLSALNTRYSGAPGAAPTDHVYAEFDPDQQHRMRAGSAVLLQLSKARLLDDTGALSIQGHTAVIEARRLLLRGAPAPSCPAGATA
ncbi:hypothetical protein M4R22_05830 [Acidovorax sp. GBBC 3334]|uniref:hypothetical protein n=1 Tax=Acidovorax sp. GBBC 3334 TaxID=2940496 RepID=UPI00230417E7|nr:hypothetical protein [Acidovorax sp. GBBC 3334]MDA8454275.1 hypothetical protein [Acidovorax sp. GBBC 3334]